MKIIKKYFQEDKGVDESILKVFNRGMSSNKANQQKLNTRKINKTQYNIKTTIYYNCQPRKVHFPESSNFQVDSKSINPRYLHQLLSFDSPVGKTADFEPGFLLQDVYTEYVEDRASTGAGTNIYGSTWRSSTRKIFTNNMHGQFCPCKKEVYNENNYINNSSKNELVLINNYLLNLYNNNDNHSDLNINTSTINSSHCNHNVNKKYINGSSSLEEIKSFENITENFNNFSHNSNNTSSPNHISFLEYFSTSHENNHKIINPAINDENSDIPGNTSNNYPEDINCPNKSNWINAINEELNNYNK
ncbi:hypothetical protein H8356DRAFT_1403253 [Neocallimastix lanati (nom. inval.)]|nr:hypothetical protein H8356DRAFT_1403253 [Neocallimastix sp. JGI-2020a]